MHYGQWKKRPYFTTHGFWVRELPHIPHEEENYGAKVNVWTTISTHGIIGLFFFHDTVTKERYKDMLENSFIPHLLATGLPIHTQWFMQDGAHPHIANMVLDFLYEMFNFCVMSHQFPECHESGKLWLPHSPDINPCDFFLWGFLKEKVFQRRPENVAQLRVHIVKLCHALSEDLCQKVETNAKVCLQEVVRQNGDHHFEHVIH